MTFFLFSCMNSAINIWMCIYVCVLDCALISVCAHMHGNRMQRCVGFFSIYKCVSACAYICVCVSACVWLFLRVCVCSCPRCALLISYQGSLFAGWQVAISPLIQGLLSGGNYTESTWQNTSPQLRSLTSSLSLWILPALFFFSASLPSPWIQRPVSHSLFSCLNMRHIFTSFSSSSLLFHIFSINILPSSSSIFTFPPVNNIILSPWSKKRRTV